MNEFKTVTNIYTGELTDSAIVNAKEIEIIKKIVTKDDVALDIGANIGFMTTILAEQAKHVYAFEPSPDNYKQLQENTKGFDNVTAYPIALSNKRGYGILYTCPKDNGMNRLYNSHWCKGGEQIRVGILPLDRIHYFSLDNIKIDFIKLDVEGYEYYAIMGMEKLLWRDHPTVMMEFHPPTLEEAGTNPQAPYYLFKHVMGYNDPINVNTGEPITSYQELDKQTRDQPAVNILWKYK
jgi:FkbM family methyltransferase